jgi:hypothetical protein
LHDQEKKRIEKWFLEAARNASAIIPAGDISESEKPDFTLASADGLIGIEVTELLREGHEGPFKPVAEEDFHKKVVRLAEEYYRQSGARAVKVSVFFTNDWKITRRAEDVARSLFEFVESQNQRATSPVTFSRRHALPEGFDRITIGPPDGSWSCGELGGALLRYEHLAASIRDKENLLPTYRDNLRNARIWLLIYISVTVARSLAVPTEDLRRWTFESSFDKILLFSSVDNRVFEIAEMDTNSTV